MTTFSFVVCSIVFIGLWSIHTCGYGYSSLSVGRGLVLNRTTIGSIYFLSPAAIDQSAGNLSVMGFEPVSISVYVNVSINNGYKGPTGMCILYLSPMQILRQIGQAGLV